jgi:WD40 repeat protein/DNA-binding SARP family transcriptional activator
MQILTLGEVALGNTRLDSLPAKRLIGYLIAVPNPTNDRSEIAAALWPDAPKPRDNLRNALADVNSVLAHAGIDPADVFEISREGLTLRRSITVDIRTFRNLLERSDVDSAREAIALYRGVFMPGVSDEWVENARRRAEEDFCSALRIAAAGLSESDPRESNRLAQLWSEISPLSQEPCRIQMRQQATLGEIPEALMVYHRLAERLNRDLAISPDNATVELYEEILRSTGVPGDPQQHLMRTPERDAGLLAYLRRIVDEYDSYERHARQRTLRVEPRLRVALKQHYLPVPIAEFNRSVVLDDARATLIRSIQRGDTSTCVVLGDYGAGKSSVLWTVAVQLAHDYIADPERARYPVLLALRDVGYVKHGWEMVRSLLQRQDLGETALSALRSLNDRGRVVFLLDGLDELGRGMSAQQLLLSWQRIRDTVAAGSYAIVTCRSSFFRGARQLADSIVPRQEMFLKAITASEASEAVAPRLFELRPWSSARVQERLDVAWGANWRHYWNRLKYLHPRLADLAARPGFLEMVIDTRHLLESAQDAHLVDLLTAHTELWYRHDEPRSHLGREQKRRLLEEVALTLWQSRQSTIEEDQLRSIVQALVDEPLDRLTQKACEEDIEVCAQLEWSPEGYRFASDLHLAHAVASALATCCRQRDLTSFGIQRLGPEATTFLARLTARDGWLNRDRLLSLTLQPVDPANPFVGGNAGSLLVARDEDMSGLRLAGASFRGAYLTGACLTRTELSGADLSQAVLDGAMLDGCDLSNANLDGTIFGQGGRIGIIRLDPRGETFAMADHFGVVSMWELQSRRRLSARDGHQDEVWALAWSQADPDFLATGSLDRTVRFWQRAGDDLRRRPDLGVLPHADWVLGISWAADGRRLATSCADGLVRIWEVGGAREPRMMDLAGDVHGVAWHPSDDVIAVATGTSAVAIWTLDNARLRYLDAAGSVATWSVAWSPDGQFLASTSDDGVVRVWSTGTWEEVAPHHGLHQGAALGCAWSPDSRLLASSGGDHVIRIWKLPELVIGAELTGHSADTWNLTWHPTADLLLSASDDATVCYWNPTASGTPIHTLIQPPRCNGADIRDAHGLAKQTKHMLVAAGAIA